MVVARCEDDHVAAVFDFITELPKEFTVATLRNLMDAIGPAALATPKFAAYVQKNQSLISASFTA